MVRLYELELEKKCPYGADPEADWEVLRALCAEKISDFDEKLIRKAYDFCVNDFQGILRSSNDPYYTHPLKVAISLIREFGIADNTAVAAALLHDTIEDVDDINYEDIYTRFNYDVAQIVDGVTKIKGSQTRLLDKASTYVKLFQALIKDVRVIFIKLADRLDNMRTLYHLPLYKQKLIGHETLNFYTPFAQRLGLTRIKRILEDLALYFYDRTAYEVINPALELKRKDFLGYIQQFYDLMTDKLTERAIPHVLTIEHKHVYEIYKMIEQGKSLSEIENFFSMVITLMTDDFAECYKTYGVIANVFGPVSSFEDYIAKPKVNLYRAIHSVHYGPGRKLVEVIIRTEEMDKIAEGGIAALHSITDARSAFKITEEELEAWTHWMESVVMTDEEDSVQKIWGSIRSNLYEEQITLFTHDGNSYSLPAHSCPIDLAFAVSEADGLHIISAKVNGEIKSLRYELNDNDKVQLITSAKSLPEPAWEDYVVTIKAIIGLNNYFTENSRELVPKVKVKKEVEAKFKILGEDRSGMLNDITNAIGQINIQRINLYKTSNSVFEGVFTLNVHDMSNLNSLFSKILSIKGIRGIERMEE